MKKRNIIISTTESSGGMPPETAAALENHSKKINADIRKKAIEKTKADYALILVAINGHSIPDAIKAAEEEQFEPLFQALLDRNIEFIKTGRVKVQIPNHF